MKRLSCTVGLVILLFFSGSRAAETVGAASYTYIGPNDYQFSGCADNAMKSCYTNNPDPCCACKKFVERSY
jgi:hypothetical protein